MNVPVGDFNPPPLKHKRMRTHVCVCGHVCTPNGLTHFSDLRRRAEPESWVLRPQTHLPRWERGHQPELKPKGFLSVRGPDPGNAPAGSVVDTFPRCLSPGECFLQCVWMETR